MGWTLFNLKIDAAVVWCSQHQLLLVLSFYSPFLSPQINWKRCEPPIMPARYEYYFEYTSSIIFSTYSRTTELHPTHGCWFFGWFFIVIVIFWMILHCHCHRHCHFRSHFTRRQIVRTILICFVFIHSHCSSWHLSTTFPWRNFYFAFLIFIVVLIVIVSTIVEYTRDCSQSIIYFSWENKEHQNQRDFS